MADILYSKTFFKIVQKQSDRLRYSGMKPSNRIGRSEKQEKEGVTGFSVVLFAGRQLLQFIKNKSKEHILNTDQ